MPSEMYVITYDIGTTGVKASLFAIGTSLSLVESSMAEYPLHILPNGGAEQNPLDWWEGMCLTTKHLLESSAVAPNLVRGISFCSQMQGLVLVDESGAPVRPAMSYMDQRAEEEKRTSVGHGIQVQGINLRKLIKSLRISSAAPASVKDPLWKYKWVERNEPEVFSKVHKWLDVKEYLIAACTGQFVMTPDSAFATFLYDSREKRGCWSHSLCKMYGVQIKHLPAIVSSTDSVGTLLPVAAKQLGLSSCCQVFGGGGDATLIGVGSGAVSLGDTHIYSGTSGWVSTVVGRRVMDVRSMIASVVGVEVGKFNYFGELETSGKCLEWVKDHLALDEIDIYLEKSKVTDDPEAVSMNLYDYMCDSIKDTPAGSGGVIFAPWLHGNRCPFEDSYVRGMFFNISLDTGKRKLIRAVLEGVSYHTRWMLEASQAKVATSRTIRFVGGGALSSLTCQIMADVTGHSIETVDNPQNVGSFGAAVCCGIGLGVIPDFTSVKKWVPVTATYTPNAQHRGVYDRGFAVFKQLYTQNKKLFKQLNA